MTSQDVIQDLPPWRQEKERGCVCGRKRKASEDEPEERKQKRVVLTEVYASLQKDTDQLAESHGSCMALKRQ